MRRVSRNLAILVMVLVLVLMGACAPAPEKITPEPTPAPVPTPTPAPAPEPAPLPTPPPAVEQGIIEFRVTDPPPPAVKSAYVTLTNIDVHQVAGNASGWVRIFEKKETFNLFDIIDEVVALVSANVTAGKYTQIRMDVIQVEGETTDNVSYTAEVPSGTLKIVRPFNVEPNTQTNLTLDFDGSKSLVITGKDKVLFKPVVKLLVEEGVKLEGMKLEREKEREKEREGEELEFVGTIDIIDGDNWTMTIEGETWIVDVSEAEIEGEPAVGLKAEVEGIVVDDTIIASDVEIIEGDEVEVGKKEREKEREKEKEGEELEFEGTIEDIDGDNWTMTIEGETWIVDVSEAEIEGEPAEGLKAEVEGIVVDNTIIASDVEIKEEE